MMRRARTNGRAPKKVWADRIEFDRLDIANPEKVSSGITEVVDDVIGFRRA
jgi:hypothetical protein